MIAKLAGAVGVAVPPTLGQILSSLSPTAFVGRVADGLRGFATDAVLVLIYLGFLLASRQGFERKAGALFAVRRAPPRAELFLRIRDAIEQYLWIQAVTCGMIALASWAVMAALGLDNALFWAFAIFIVGFIPIIGGAVGILAPPLFALVQFDGWWRAAAMLACLQVINFIVGNIIYPRMQGKSLNLDPVAVLLSLAFWGAIWGLPGMFLSTPLTVMAMVILAQFHSTHWIAVLLSSDGEPLGERAVAPRRSRPPMRPRRSRGLIAKYSGQGLETGALAPISGRSETSPARTRCAAPLTTQRCAQAKRSRRFPPRRDPRRRSNPSGGVSLSRALRSHDPRSPPTMALRPLIATSRRPRPRIPTRAVEPPSKRLVSRHSRHRRSHACGHSDPGPRRRRAGGGVRREPWPRRGAADLTAAEAVFLAQMREDYVPEELAGTTLADLAANLADFWRFAGRRTQPGPAMQIVEAIGGDGRVDRLDIVQDDSPVPGGQRDGRDRRRRRVRARHVPQHGRRRPRPRGPAPRRRTHEARVDDPGDAGQPGRRPRRRPDRAAARRPWPTCAWPSATSRPCWP